MSENNNLSELMERLAATFIKEMEFTKDFNLELIEFDETHVVLKFPMRDALQGNILQNILHGGATATVLDSASGMVAIAAAFARNKHEAVEVQLKRIAKAATVDLRIDYLRPGRGKYFIAKAEILRRGNKITVVDSYLYNDQESLLARATGTYLVGH